MSEYIDFDEELEDKIIENAYEEETYAYKAPLKYKILPLIASLLTACVLVAGFFGYKYLTPAGKAQREKIYTQEDMDEALNEQLFLKEEAVATASEEGYQRGKKNLLADLKADFESGDGTTAILKRWYPESIVVGYNNAYHFVPITDELPHNDYDSSRMVIDEETGEITYLDEASNVISKKGIDVSAHQGTIDWTAVKNDGVEFAIIRTLYRGYESGALVEDSYYKQNISGAKRNGIKIGVYVFTQAITEAEAIEEADKVLEQTKDVDLDLPIVLDVERVSSATGRFNLITPEERTRIVRTFCDRIKAAGKTPMLYYNTQMGALLLDISQFTDMGVWFAGYTPELYWPYEYNIWQYSSSGTVKGIKGNVDMNIMLKPLE